MRPLDADALARLREATVDPQRRRRSDARENAWWLLSSALWNACKHNQRTVGHRLRLLGLAARKGLRLAPLCLLLLPSLAHASPGGASDWDGGYLMAGLVAGIIALIWLMEEVD